MGFEVLSERLAEIARNLDEQFPTTIAMQSMIELQGEWLDRIARGENSDNQPIGVYSTKANYFSKDKFARAKAFKPIGKTGKKTKTTMYLQGGYNQFRDINQRETPEVNLKFSGSMLGAFRVYKFGSEVVFGNADALEHKKVEGNTDRFGEWSALTEGEKEFLKEAIVDKAIIVAKK